VVACPEEWAGVQNLFTSAGPTCFFGALQRLPDTPVEGFFEPDGEAKDGKLRPYGNGT
jgi:hypothetical protein